MPLDADALLERRRLKRRLAVWRALAVLAVVALGLAFLAVSETVPIAGGGDHVARIHVRGVVVEDAQLEQTLDRIARDPRARALIVKINSPGGSTYGGESLYRAIRRVAEHKPVVAVIGTLGASAGYLIALSSDRIFARETSLTGSIGVLFQSPEFSKLMAKIGVEAQTVTSGPFKDEPSMFRPFSERGRQAIQELVNQTHQWFVGLVAERRQITPERARSLADGRLYSGTTALNAGLIDELGGEREARAWLAVARGVDAQLPIRDVAADGTVRRFRDFVGLAEKVFLSERLTLDGLISVWQAE